jgi:hypothetical protein
MRARLEEDQVAVTGIVMPPGRVTTMAHAVPNVGFVAGSVEGPLGWALVVLLPTTGRGR